MGEGRWLAIELHLWVAFFAECFVYARKVQSGIFMGEHGAKN